MHSPYLKLFQLKINTPVTPGRETFTPVLVLPHVRIIKLETCKEQTDKRTERQARPVTWPVKTIATVSAKSVTS